MSDKRRILGVDYADDVEGAYRRGELGDTPFIEKIMDHAVRAGMTDVCWRVSHLGKLTYRTQAGTVQDGHLALRPSLTPFGLILKRCDPVEEAARAAHERGLKLWFYITLFDECYEENGVVSESALGAAHPEYYARHFSGQGCVRGVFSLSYDEVRQYFLGILKEGLERGCDVLYIDCARTHAGGNPIPVHGWWPQWSNPYLAYGYNEPDVERYRRQYGEAPPVRRVTDSSSLEPTEAELNWNRVRGEALTVFLREARALARPHDTPVVVAFYPATYNGFNPGYQCREMLGRYHVDWRTWVSEGLMDGIRLIVDHRRFGYDDWVADSATTYAEAQKRGIEVYLDCCLSGRIDQLENPPRPLPISRADDPAFFDALKAEYMGKMLNSSADGVFYYEHASGDDQTWDVLGRVHAGSIG